jgi:hypothetical protein
MLAERQASLDKVEAERIREREAMLAERQASLDKVEAERIQEHDAILAERHAVIQFHEQQLADARRQLSDVESAISQCETQTRQAQRAARLFEDRAHHFEDEALQTELGAAKLRDRLAYESAARLAAEQAALNERAARDASERELRTLRATRTFRWTSPLRSLYGYLRRP